MPKWQGLIESPEVSAVIVATPPVLHAEASIAAFEAGKYVLCQGRMSRNLREAKQMVDAACRHSGLVAAL